MLKFIRYNKYISELMGLRIYENFPMIYESLIEKKAKERKTRFTPLAGLETREREIQTDEKVVEEIQHGRAA